MLIQAATSFALGRDAAGRWFSSLTTRKNKKGAKFGVGEMDLAAL